MHKLTKRDLKRKVAYLTEELERQIEIRDIDKIEQEINLILEFHNQLVIDYEIASYLLFILSIAEEDMHLDRVLLNNLEQRLAEYYA